MCQYGRPAASTTLLGRARAGGARGRGHSGPHYHAYRIQALPRGSSTIDHTHLLVEGWARRRVRPERGGMSRDPTPTPVRWRSAQSDEPKQSPRQNADGVELQGKQTSSSNEDEQPLLPEGGGTGEHNDPLDVFTQGIDRVTIREVCNLSAIAKYVASNPRKIKRITNSYLVARALELDLWTSVMEDVSKLDEWTKKKFSKKLMLWTFMCEEWPTRVSWILLLLETEEESCNGELCREVATMTLRQFYDKFVQQRLYDTAIEQCSEPLKKRYQQMFMLDGQAEAFDALLRHNSDSADPDERLLVQDIGSFRLRSKGRLNAYTTSLNPGPRLVLRHICDQREKVGTDKADSNKQFSRRDLCPTQSQQAENVGQTGNSGAEKDGARDGDSKLIELGSGMLDEFTKNVDAEKTFIGLRTGKALAETVHTPDLMGYKQYAIILSRLILGAHASSPFVVGVYGAWGVGKSFIMNQIEMYLKGGCLAQLLSKSQSDDPKKQGSEDVQRRRYRERLASLLQNGDEEKVRRVWNKSYKKIDLEFHTLREALLTPFVQLKLILWALPWTIFVLAYDMLRALFRSWGRNRGGGLQINYDKSLEALVTPDSGDVESSESSQEDKERDVEYDFVRFNAWLYNGTDNLWAAFVWELYRAVEIHYGYRYKFARRRANLWIISIYVTLLLGVTVFVACAFVFWVDFDEADSLAGLKGFGLILFAALTLIVSGWKLVLSFREIYKDTLELSGRLRAQVRGAAVHDKLGFMNTVREELEKIKGILDNPEELENEWDVFLTPFTDQQRKTLKWLFELPFNLWRKKKHKPCKLCILVDDLDRCDQDKCVEVLGAISLMSQGLARPSEKIAKVASGLPFIIVLAIDPRVVVSAIESCSEKLYEKVGLNGYTYLDKIVQLPFSIPASMPDEKERVVQGMFAGVVAEAALALASQISDERVQALVQGTVKDMYGIKKKKLDSPSALSPDGATVGLDGPWSHDCPCFGMYERSGQVQLVGALPQRVACRRPGNRRRRRGGHRAGDGEERDSAHAPLGS
eukprot:scaffold748_cov161-Prasinococcus_capsulatus_cf.AAC.2